MPRYKRYGYVTFSFTEKVDKTLVAAGNVAFHLNPKKALDNLDDILEEAKTSDRFVKIVEDTTEKNLYHIGGLTLRTVLIEYVEGHFLRYCVEQWGVEVGRS